MSNYAILRVRKRGMAQAAAMARHALREASTPNADPAKVTENTVMGPSTAAGVMADLRAKLPEKRRKDAVPCIELFIGASPEAMRAMTRKQQDAYFKRALGWIGERFGGKGNMVSAVVHRDETTPHMQVLLVPLLDGKLNAKRLVGNRGDMQQMQTDFAEKVGAPHGLRRGEKGSRAKHTSIKQFYGAMEAAGRPEALPPRVPVPRPLPEPGMFASEAKREAYAKREKERAEAMAANKRRQAEVERLAALAVATHGRARRAPRQLANLERDTEQAAKLLEQQRQEFNQAADQVKGLKAEVPALMKKRDTLARQVNELAAQLEQLTPKRPRPRE